MGKEGDTPPTALSSAYRQLAAGEAMAGRLREAQAATALVLQLDPSLCISHLVERFPFRRMQDIRRPPLAMYVLAVRLVTARLGTSAAGRDEFSRSDVTQSVARSY
jgi:hypothetical protein